MSIFRTSTALMRDVFRVLKPGGWFVASDWLIGHDHEPSPEMKAYIASEGLDFGMASPLRYADAMASPDLKGLKRAAAMPGTATGRGRN